MSICVLNQTLVVSKWELTVSGSAYKECKKQWVRLCCPAEVALYIFMFCWADFWRAAIGTERGKEKARTLVLKEQLLLF